MWPYHGAGGPRRFFAILAVVALLGLIAEAIVALTIPSESARVPAPDRALAAAPVAPSTTPSTPAAEPAPPVPASPRPRIRIELPRLALWPAPAPTVAPTTASVASAVGAGPVSAAFIDDYLARKDSAMMGLGPRFWAWGRQYDVDPRLLVAISGSETGFGRIITSRFNAFNWFYRGTWDSDFASWDEAIEVVSRGIRLHYLDEGLTTVELLGAKYGPIGAANDPLNLNVNFAPNVTGFLREMGGDPAHLTFD